MIYVELRDHIISSTIALDFRDPFYQRVAFSIYAATAHSLYWGSAVPMSPHSLLTCFESDPS